MWMWGTGAGFELDRKCGMVEVLCLYTQALKQVYRKSQQINVHLRVAVCALVLLGFIRPARVWLMARSSRQGPQSVDYALDYGCHFEDHSSSKRNNDALVH